MTQPRVAIIGAGIIGVTCALRLARAGYKVTLVDEQAEGQSGVTASRAAAGMLAPLSESADGGGGHPRFAELCFAAFNAWRTFSHGAEWEPLVHFDGALFVAEEIEKARALERSARRAQCPARRLDPAVAQGEFGRATAHGFFIGCEGAADAPRLYTALVALARARGVSFRHGFVFDGFGAFTVFDAGGAPIAADHIVLAPGASRDARLRAAAPVLRHIRPVKGHVARVAVARPLRLTLHAPGFYIARNWNGELTLGATMEWDRDDLDVEPSRISGPLDAANAFLGGGVAVTELRAGVRPMSPDGAPLIGPARAAGAASAFVAAGHGRNGWLLAPITAEMICAYVMGRPIPPLWAAFHPDRFETTP